MKVLFTGNGKSGSWKIRGDQIGHALGAKVVPHATLKDFRSVDKIIVVKRTPDSTVLDLAASGRPWAWDIVDSYPQPGCSRWDKSESIRWARKEINRLNPSAVIWPNEKMRDDVGCDVMSIVIPHHHRPGIRVNPIREHVKTVGYEGSPRYIEGLDPFIREECRKRGWGYVVNPEHMADLDIVLALRSGPWNGYAQKHWKSNVKLANAHGSGTPFVGSREDGYLENATGCEYWADSQEEITTAFDFLTSQTTRQQVADRFLSAAYSIDRALKRYRVFIDAL